MKYRNLGSSSLKVSELCLGTMTFGAQTDFKESKRIVDFARENGVNFIDTADVYVHGESERIVGKLLDIGRTNWVLATKVGNAFGDDVNEKGLSRKWIHRSCNDSLQRIGTDYLDILYLHRDYEPTSLVETVRAVGDLIKDGKVLYWGLSNFRGWRIAQIIAICKEVGVPSPVVCQPYYNAVNRMPEVEILPACHNFGIGVVPYSPIARGILTGKYHSIEAPASETRAGRNDKRMMETEFRAESIEIAKAFVKRASDKGVTPGQFAVAWVLKNKIVSSVIGGPRTFEQWEDYFGALEIQLDGEDEKFVDNLVPPGHPSTPGYSDPAYPICGRIIA